MKAICPKCEEVFDISTSELSASIEGVIILTPTMKTYGNSPNCVVVFICPHCQHREPI